MDGVPLLLNQCLLNCLNENGNTFDKAMLFCQLMACGRADPKAHKGTSICRDYSTQRTTDDVFLKGESLA